MIVNRQLLVLRMVALALDEVDANKGFTRRGRLYRTGSPVYRTVCGDERRGNRIAQATALSSC